MLRSKNSLTATILKSVDSYYSEKVREHGNTAQGVDWKDMESQFVRFSQLARIFPESQNEFSINDLGCGYGAFFEYVIQNDLTCNYTGYDISGEMIEAAEKHWGKTDLKRQPHFVHDNQMDVADFTIASGIFNVMQDADEFAWLDYVVETLSQMNRNSSKGFAFNMLTKYSDPPFMRDYLWYADPSFIFDYCMQRFSRKVCLTHDYQLYEFTVLVRKP